MAERLSPYRQQSQQNIMAELQRRGLVRSPVEPPEGDELAQPTLDAPSPGRPAVQPTLGAPPPSRPTVEAAPTLSGKDPSILKSPLMGVPQDEIFAEMVRRGLVPDGFPHISEDPKFGEINPKDTDNDRGFLNTTIGNIIPSGKAAIEGALSLFTPSGLLRTGQALTGAGIGVVEKLQGKETRNTKMAGLLFKEATRIFRDPIGTIQNDPVGAMLDVAGVLTGGATIAARVGVGGARVAQAAKTLAKVEKTINPVMVIGTVGAKVVGKTAKAGLGAAKRGVAVASGLGLAPIETALAAGRAGGRIFKGGKDQSRMGSLFAALKGDTDAIKTAERVQEGVNEVKKMRDLEYQERFKDLSLKDDLKEIDIGKVRSKVANAFEGEGIKVYQIAPGQVRKADKLKKGKVEFTLDAELLDDKGKNVSPGIGLDFNDSSMRYSYHEQKQIADVYEAFMRWEDNSITGSHMVNQSMNQIFSKQIGSDYTNIDRIRDKVLNHVVRDEMISKVKGFKEMNEQYRDASQVLNSLESTLRLKPTSGDPGVRYGETGQVSEISEAVLTKLGNTLNTRGSGNLALRRNLVRELEASLNRSALVDKGIKRAKTMGSEEVLKIARREGVSTNLMETLAGLKFSIDETPGIARARNTIGLGTLLGGGVGALTTGGVGAVAGAAAANWIGNMTIRNPRAVGRFFVGLGASSADMAEVVKHLERIKAKIPLNEINTTRTIGVALERARQRKETNPEDQQLFQKLGLVKLPTKKN